MHHEIKIPNRTLLFVGPQRSGKTFAMLAALAQASMEFKILVISDANYFNSLKDDIAAFGNLDNILRISIDTSNVANALEKKGWALRDIGTVALLESTVFQDVGMVKAWREPSASVIELFNRLCEPTAMTPRVYVESHMRGHENDVAVG